jgi:hypothetical protein
VPAGEVTLAVSVSAWPKTAVLALTDRAVVVGAAVVVAPLRTTCSTWPTSAIQMLPSGPTVIPSPPV